MSKETGKKVRSKKPLSADSRIPPAAKAIPAVPEAPRQMPVDTKKRGRLGSRRKKQDEG
jgi:hypothetical protein